MKTITISDGRSITLADLDVLTQSQTDALLTGVVDLLVRSGRIGDDVALTGPDLVQALGEIADDLDPGKAEDRPVTITGTLAIDGSACGLRYGVISIAHPYEHEAQVRIVARDNQDDDDLDNAIDHLLRHNVTVSARLVNGHRVCTSDDIVRI